jgi:hypothetical protein
MKRYLLTTLLISTCTVATQAMAYDLNDAANTVNQAANTAHAVQDVNDRFTDAEHNEYKSYYNKKSKDKKQDKDDDGQGENKGNKGHDKNLPPGLQKKVNNGGSLPPGWQKKVDAGQVFSPELRSYSTRSPYSSPKGTSTYILDNKVVRVLDATNVILDVLTN